MSAFLDELARSLARPMPRSRALRFMGGALLSVAIPSVFTGRAWGRRVDGCNAKGGGCVKTARCCYGSDGVAVSCCPWYIRCRPRSGLCGEKYVCEDGRDFCDKASKRCCLPDEICFKGVCIEPCPPDQVVCNEQCCPKGHECVRAAPGGGPRIEVCLPKCTRGRSRCGFNCCKAGWKCKDPVRSICSPCGTGEEPCGKKCCNKKTHYCGNSILSLCCPNDASACPTGYPAKRNRTCCRRPSKCARQLPAESGAITAASPYVCCPPERQVPDDPDLCCAPGQVPLGGKIVAGFGIQGFCCNRSQLCGSGANITCCQRFSANIGTDLNQTCCSGKCVTLNSDPANCGRCGRQCPPGQRCARGVCAA